MMMHTIVRMMYNFVLLWRNVTYLGADNFKSNNHRSSRYQGYLLQLYPFSIPKVSPQIRYLCGGEAPLGGANAISSNQKSLPPDAFFA
jgi:hypothetical protein